MPAEQLDAYIRTLEAACVSEPPSPDLLTCLGVAHAAKAEHATAQLAFQKAIAADPEHFFARLRYAELLLSLEQFAEAAVQVRAAAAAARNRAERAMAKRLLRQIRRAANNVRS
ncbi:MAG TPA: hypothetical protein VFL57_15195 [Bryobacteraceae bacterium]|nr:hypothetical protein [Bryobacteraceae bacterium]